MLLLVMLVLAGCGSPVENYMQQVEELEIDVAIEEISNDMDTLLSSEGVIPESDLENVAKNVSELKGRVDTVSIDDEEVSGIHNHLVNYVNELNKLLNLFKDFNKMVSKTEQLDKKMNEINKAAEKVDAELSKSSAVNDKAYNYFIAQKNMDKVMNFLDNLDKSIQENKDVKKQLADIKKIVNDAPASTIEGQKIIEMIKDLVNLAGEYLANNEEGDQIVKSLTDYEQKINERLTVIEQEITEWATALDEYYE